MKKLLVVSSLLVVMLLSGCELLLLDAAMDFNLKLEPEQTTITHGSSQSVKVKVSRILPVNVAPIPISVTLYNAPGGITLEGEQVDIPSGLDERDLTIHVADTTKLGNYELTIEGTTGSKTKQTKLKLTIN